MALPIHLCLFFSVSLLVPAQLYCSGSPQICGWDPSATAHLCARLQVSDLCLHSGTIGSIPGRYHGESLYFMFVSFLLQITSSPSCPPFWTSPRSQGGCWCHDCSDVFCETVVSVLCLVRLVFPCSIHLVRHGIRLFGATSSCYKC